MSGLTPAQLLGDNRMKFPLGQHQLFRLSIIWCGIATTTFLFFGAIGFFNGLNDLLLDQVMVHADDRQPDQRLLVIEIDDESVRQLGKPVPRSNYATLIQKLPALGVQTIVFDLLFIDEEIPESDARLAALSDSVYHVVHCFKFSDQTPDSTLFQNKSYEKYAIALLDQSGLDLLSARDAVFPHPRFIETFHQAGHIAVEWDYDGRSRRMPLFYLFNDRVYPAMGLAAVFDYFHVVDRTVKIESSFWGRNAVIETPNGSITIPIDSRGQMLLNFYGIFDRFKPIPLFQMKNLVDAIHLSRPATEVLPIFEGKIALIGNTETGMDKYETPFSAEFPGVGFHATFISNCLKDDFIREASTRGNAVIWALLAMLLLSSFLYHQKISRSFWALYIFPIGILILFNLFAYLILFKTFDIWLHLIQINGCYGVLFVAMVFYEKIVRVKDLSAKIEHLNREIERKNGELEKLSQQIHSQQEQYKTIEYFVKGLQSAMNGSPLNTEAELEKFFPEFFAQYQRMKQNLDEQMLQLTQERERIAQEKHALEHERAIYRGILKGSVVDKPQQKSEPMKKNKMEIAQQIMLVWHYFQSQQKRGAPLPQPIPGFIAVTAMVNEKNQKVATSIGEVLEKIALVSRYDSTVLITGEVGVGKELVARAIHEQSGRADKRLVVINCATLPEHLMESELFGHKKGSFTDAKYDHKGAFEYADGGTIFLDEIGELKLDLQAKLLRVLQNKEFQKVGSNETIKVNVRVIAATNRDLKTAVESHQFRPDLFSRLQVVDLHIPALRERKHDIPFLVQYFLNKFNSKHGKSKSFSNEAIIAMICYDWPNNIRQLEHVIERACVLTSGDQIPLSALSDDIQAAYREIFESEEVPWWNQIESLVLQEQKRLLLGCKAALKKGKIEAFLQSSELQANHKICANCYEYLAAFVNGIASIFDPARREMLVRQAIVQMQEELLHWCHLEKIDKLSQLYDKIERLLGRSRRQIDNWRRAG